jgi:glycosyltransferase involved in cell wall biosynthesis
MSAETGRPLRILMIAPTSFFNDYGGHIRILEETRTLQQMGHEVLIVTYYKGNPVSGINIQRTPALPWRVDYEVGSSRHKIAFDLVLLATSIRQGLKNRPDIIHGHMHEGALIGSLVAALLRIPLVMDFQGSLTGEMVDHGFLKAGGFFFRWVRRLERFICQLPESILTSSHKGSALLANDFGVPKEKLVPLPDCVDVSSFDPRHFSAEGKQKLKDTLGIPAERPVVVYLGLLAEYQGTSHLIRAAAKIKQSGKEVHFLIMGYPGIDHYQALAQQSGVEDRVTFTGRIPYAEAPKFLSLGDLAVSVKMSSTEGSGKVLNYMAMGLPTVAYDSIVHREYLADLGTYVPLGDIDVLSTTIIELLYKKNQVERSQLGIKLRERAVKEYNWHDAGEQITVVYRNLRDNM